MAMVRVGFNFQPRFQDILILIMVGIIVTGQDQLPSSTSASFSESSSTTNVEAVNLLERDSSWYELFVLVGRVCTSKRGRVDHP